MVSTQRKTQMNYDSLPLALRVEVANAALEYAKLETIAFASAFTPSDVVSFEEGEAAFVRATNAKHELNTLMERAAHLLAR